MSAMPSLRGEPLAYGAVRSLEQARTAADEARREGLLGQFPAACVVLDMAFARVVASNAELLDALQWFVMLRPLPGEDSNDTFERIAEVFRNDTGYLRPGKDCVLYPPELRRAIWDAWIDSHVEAARAVIARATGAES